MLRGLGVSVSSTLIQPVTPSTRLLLIDPDVRSARLLSKHLEAQAFSVSALQDVSCGFDHIVSASPHLGLLAETLPEEEAFSFCRQLRLQANPIPVLILLSGNHFSSRVAALKAGADDVLSHPFAIDELIARINALLRRSRMVLDQSIGQEIAYRDLLVNTDTRQVWRAGMPVKLTVKEYDLMLLLLRNSNHVMTRKRLMLDVWGESWVGNGNLLDVYIRYLRNKLGGPESEPLIHTVRGVGFMLK